MARSDCRKAAQSWLDLGQHLCGAIEVAFGSIDGCPQEQYLARRHGVPCLLRLHVAAFGIVGGFVQPLQVPQRSGIVDEDHR